MAFRLQPGEAEGRIGAIVAAVCAYCITEKGALQEMPVHKFVTAYALAYFAAKQWFPDQRQSSSGIRRTIREIADVVVSSPIEFSLFSAAFYMMYRAPRS